MINGKLFVRSTKTTSKKQAEQIARQYEREWVSHAVLNERQPITLGSALDKFLGGKRNEPGLRTWAIHAAILRRYFNTDIALHHLSNVDVASFIQRRRQEGKSDDTIRLSLSALRGAIKAAEQMGYAVCSTQNWPSVGKKAKRLRFLSVDEENRLLNELDPHAARQGIGKVQRSLRQDQYDYVVALLDTGARAMEVAELPWSAVDFDTNTIHIHRSKTNHSTVLQMTDRLRAILQRRYQQRGSNNAYVFPSPNGGHRQYRSEAIMNAIDQAGLNDAKIVRQKGGKVTLHTFRHTFCSRLAQAGVSLQKIAHLAGHGDIKTTMIYAHLVPSDVAGEAVNVLNAIRWTQTG
ncbi:MAG: site-specific integrase [Gammaproteobacteria bacterium]|jgi:integrase